MRRFLKDRDDTESVFIVLFLAVKIFGLVLAVKFDNVHTLLFCLSSPT